MKTTLLFLLFLFITLEPSHAQSSTSDEVALQWLESLAEEGMDIESVPEIETLMQYLNQPLNINEATKQDLEQLFFLSPKQIENILFYLHENGSLITIYELQAIEMMNEKTINLLKPFITIAPPNHDKSLVKSETITRAQTLIQKPQGYHPPNDSTPPPYLGSQFKWLAKCKIETDHFSTGCILEKDAGEPTFTNQIPITDHIAGFIGYRGNKKIKKLIIGDYRLSLGQGLALSTATSMGLSADPVNIRNRVKQLSGYASTDENRYLQGIAAQIDINSHITITPFASLKSIDGTLANNNDNITAISTTGYHRTITEISRRHNTNELISGAAIQYEHSKWNIQAGGFHYHLNKVIAPENQPYKLYQLNQQQYQSFYLSHTALVGKTVAFGEIACMDYSKWAVSEGFTWEPDSKLAIALRYQQFSNGFQSPYNNAGSKNDKPSGEQNISIGFRIIPKRKISIDGSHMLYQNNWLRYQIDAPSHGSQTTIRTNWEYNTAFKIQLQYKHRQYQHNKSNTTSAVTVLSTISQNNLRVQCTYLVNNEWRLTSRAEYCHFDQQTQSNSQGVVLLQDVTYHHPLNKWTLTLRYCQFNTDDYNSRIYTYEPEMLYGFSIPALSGVGNRIVFNTRISATRNIDLYLRYARLTDAQNSTIGSGYDTINQPSKDEIKIQVRYTFNKHINH